MTTTSLSLSHPPPPPPPLPPPPSFLYPHPTSNTHFLTRSPPPRPSAILSSSSSNSNRDLWINPNKSKSKSESTHHHHHHSKTIGRRNNNDTGGGGGGGPRYIDRTVDLPSLLSSLRQTTTPAELHAVMSQFIDSNGSHLLSLRFMVTILSAEPDYRRTLALLDWMHSTASYPPSVFAYNVALRNSLRAHQFPLALGLLHEMRSPPASLRPDRVTYSTLISALSRHPRLLDPALSLLHQISQDNVPIDLVLYTNLIHLATRLNDHSKAISLFSALRTHANIAPDIIAYNSFLNVLARAGLFKEARQVLDDMDATGVAPDTVSFSTLLAALVDKRKYLEALSLFAEMRSRRIAADLTICNIMIDAYGQLDMAKEADRLFWTMRRIGIEPSVVTYNTMLRVYGDAELFGEAIHLFRLMQRKEIEQNVVTYNTMIRIYGKSLEHEKAGNLVREMKRKGIEPNAVTYSTIISIWGKAGKLDRAAMLFQKLRTSGAEIDPVLYQTMIVVYQRAGLVGHAKRLIHELRHPVNISKGTAVSVLAKAGRVEEAAWVFRQAVAAGEVKDISVYRSMIELFSRNRRHKNVIEVFDALRGAGFFPDSGMIADVLNAYGKLQEFDKAEALYKEMKDDGCLFADRVHFQMMSLLGARQDFKGVESLLEELNEDPNIDKKELHLVAANVYERANKLDEAARIIGQISKKRSSNSLALQ